MPLARTELEVNGIIKSALATEGVGNVSMMSKMSNEDLRQYGTYLQPWYVI